MAEKQRLFPTVDVPEILTPVPASKQHYKPSYQFDFTTGDFVRDGANRVVVCSGREAYLQWCMKVVHTERMTCLAYSSDIGIEGQEALAQSDRRAVESALERTISEALKVNPRTEYVRGFSFSWEADVLRCRFTVKGREWEELEIETEMRT